MKSSKVLIVGGIIFASEIVWCLYKRFGRLWTKSRNSNKASTTNVRESKQDISEVMFFSKESSLCRAHIVSEEACVRNSCSVGYLRKLEGYINMSKDSLDVCMYALTCQLLSNAIVDAHKRGVIVRIITDHRMACNDAAQTTLFHKNGMAIKFEDLDVLMHHKFAIVDNSIIITGSTNWTMAAFFGNFDHIVVTNQRLLVQPFVEEFDRLWKIFCRSEENVIDSAQTRTNDRS